MLAIPVDRGVHYVYGEGEQVGWGSLADFFFALVLGLQKVKTALFVMPC